jgi:hypothetical protein
VVTLKLRGMDIRGTTPTSSGRRVYTLSELPPADYAPAVYVEALQEYQAAYERMQKDRDAASKVASELRRADATWLQDAAEAQRQGKTKKDPRPAIKARLEQAEEAALVSEQVCTDLSDRIFEIRNDEDAKGWWKGATEAVRAELLERAERQLDELEDTLVQVAGVDYIAAWARGGKASRSVMAVNELGKIAKAIEGRKDERPHRYVTPAAMRTLRLGETVEDTLGQKLTPAEADSLLRLTPKKLHVTHAKPLPRSSTGFGDMG